MVEVIVTFFQERDRLPSNPFTNGLFASKKKKSARGIASSKPGPPLAASHHRRSRLATPGPLAA